MNSKEFSILIEKYKKGGCSPQEKVLLENYLKSFQNNPGEWNENEMGNQKIVEQKIYFGILKNISKKENQYISKIFFNPSLLKRAASIIFFLILAAGILYVSGIFQPKAEPLVWNEKVTSSGEKSTLTLSDGSKVTLNADSKLKYPNRFDDVIKEVYLEGEAYFEVRHNSYKLFIVHSENLTTTDLGTKFDVSAYPDNKTISVSLLEGKVKVSNSEKGKIDKIVFLKPNQEFLYNKENKISSYCLFDSLNAVGWKDNIYRFENEPLDEVLSKLERAYGVKFKISDQSVSAQRITVKFERNSLQTVVDVIKSLTGLNYKIIKVNNDIKEVLFFRNNK